MKLLKYKLFFTSFFLIHLLIGQNLSTPKEAIWYHLSVLQDNVQGKDSLVRNVMFPVNGVSDEESVHRAKQLKQIFDALGDEIEENALSNDPNYKNKNGAHLYPFGKLHLENNSDHHAYLDKIYVIKVEDKWLYSSTTVNAIPSIYRKIYPFGLHVFADYLNGLGHDKFLGLYYWQYFGILFLVLLLITLYKVFNILFNRIFLKLLHKYGHGNVADQYVRPVVVPFTLLIIVLLMVLLIPVLNFPVSINKWLILFFKAIIPLFVTIVLYRVVDVFTAYLAKMAEKTETTLDDQLIPLLRKVLKVLVIILGTLFMLKKLNFDILPLLTGISIGGLAFALAAQDTIKNFFGSLMIFVDRPFQMGDWITGKGIDGDVEEVGFRSTRIRTFHNSVISIPNGMLADMTIDNMGLRKYRRYKTFLSITYDTPIEKIELFVEELKKIILNHPDTRKDYYHVYFNNFSASSLEILFYIFFEVPGWGEELKAKHEINLGIMRIAQDLNVNFAFNTQTLHVESFPPDIQPFISLPKDNSER